MQKAVLFMGLGRAAANPCRRAAKSCRSRRRGGESRFMLELAARLLDPTALALVLGGTVATAAMRGTKQEVARAVAALQPLFRARPAAEALTEHRAVRAVERIGEFKGLAAPHPLKRTGEGRVG